MTRLERAAFREAVKRANRQPGDHYEGADALSYMQSQARVG